MEPSIPLRPKNKLLLFRDDYLKKLSDRGERPKTLKHDKLRQLWTDLDPSEQAIYESRYKIAMDAYSSTIKLLKKNGQYLPTKSRKHTTTERKEASSSSRILSNISARIENRSKKQSISQSKIKSSSSSHKPSSSKPHVDLYSAALAKKLKKMQAEAPLARPFKVTKGELYIFRVTLKGISPIIYRTLLLSGENTLAHLHLLIQLSFGWKNYHKHEFTLRGEELSAGENDEEDDRRTSRNETQLLIRDLGLGERDLMMYEYDFGNNWEHSIRVISKTEGGERECSIAPRLIDGRRAGPPEDIGGAEAYSEIINCIRMGRELHEEDREMLESVYEGDFDPEHFDLDQTRQVVALWEYYAQYVENL